jgi:DHA2 family multidrug resistance protein
VATFLTRGSQAWEANMTRNLTTGNPAFVDNVNRLKPLFHGGGPGIGGAFGAGRGAGGIATAQAYIYGQLHRQSAMLAYKDIITFLAIFCMCMVPMVFIIPKSKPAKDAPVH